VRESVGFVGWRRDMWTVKQCYRASWLLPRMSFAASMCSATYDDGVPRRLTSPEHVPLSASSTSADSCIATQHLDTNVKLPLLAHGVCCSCKDGCTSIRCLAALHAAP
jgi:hypothetical protein